MKWIKYFYKDKLQMMPPMIGLENEERSKDWVFLGKDKVLYSFSIWSYL